MCFQISFATLEKLELQKHKIATTNRKTPTNLTSITKTKINFGAWKFSAFKPQFFSTFCRALIFPSIDFFLCVTKRIIFMIYHKKCSEYFIWSSLRMQRLCLVWKFGDEKESLMKRRACQNVASKVRRWKRM